MGSTEDGGSTGDKAVDIERSWRRPRKQGKRGQPRRSPSLTGGLAADYAAFRRRALLRFRQEQRRASVPVAEQRARNDRSHRDSSGHSSVRHAWPVASVARRQTLIRSQVWIVCPSHSATPIEAVTDTERSAMRIRSAIWMATVSRTPSRMTKIHRRQCHDETLRHGRFDDAARSEWPSPLTRSACRLRCVPAHRSPP